MQTVANSWHPSLQPCRSFLLLTLWAPAAWTSTYCPHRPPVFNLAGVRGMSLCVPCGRCCLLPSSPLVYCQWVKGEEHITSWLCLVHLLAGAVSEIIKDFNYEATLVPHHVGREGSI
jgi:hypothetical protein